jgi:hypothetical protein
MTMEIGSFLILLAILLPVLAYLAQPIVTGQGVVVSGKDRHLSSLEAERESVLSTIQEIDMDYTLGKIEQEDYEAERSALIAQGADTMRQIDALAGEIGPSETQVADPIDRDLEAELEARVAVMRKVQDEAAIQYCTKCGTKILESDRFCSSCGADVVPAETSQ